jgi:hypothetical protein
MIAKIFSINKKISPIVRAVIALCLSVMVFIFVCVFGCYAWFADNREVSSLGLQARIVNSVIDADVSYYTCSDENGGLTFEKSDSPALGTYNALDSTKSYRALIKLEFYNNLNEVTLNAVSEANNYLGEYNDGTLISLLKASGNSVSSILSMCALDNADVTENGDKVTLKNLENYSMMHFVEVKGGSFVFNKTINIADKMQLTNSVLYILLDYNEDALLDIFGKNLGNDLGDGDVLFNLLDFYFEAS